MFTIACCLVVWLGLELDLESGSLASSYSHVFLLLSVVTVTLHIKNQASVTRGNSVRLQPAIRPVNQSIN